MRLERCPNGAQQILVFPLRNCCIATPVYSVMAGRTREHRKIIVGLLGNPGQKSAGGQEPLYLCCGCSTAVAGCNARPWRKRVAWPIQGAAGAGEGLGALFCSSTKSQYEVFNGAFHIIARPVGEKPRQNHVNNGGIKALKFVLVHFVKRNRLCGHSP